MQKPVYFQYRQFPSSFNLVGLRARMRLHEISSEALPSSSRNLSSKELYKISTKNTLKSIKNFNKQKSLPEIIKQEGKIASSLISTERKYQHFIQKKYTIKLKPKLKLTTTFYNSKPLSLKMSSSSLSPMKSMQMFNQHRVGKSKTLREKSLKGITSIRRSESLPNFEQSKSNFNNLCVSGNNEPPLYLSLNKKYFKMTSHALINLSTFKTNKRNNILDNDGFDFDKVKLFDYVRIKKK